MPKRFSLVFVLSFSHCMLNYCFSQIPCSDFVFNRWYNEMYNTGIRDCKPTKDGNFVIVGSYITNIDIFRCLIYKINSQGEVLWRNDILHDNTYETAYSVAELPDGSFVVAGNAATLQDAGTLAHGYLAKFDANGKFLWEKIYDISNWVKDFSDIAICPNEDLIVTGVQATNTGANLWVARLDSTGNLLWNKTFTKGAGFSILALPTGGIWVCAEEIILGYPHAWLIRLDDAGNIINEFYVNGPATWGKLRELTLTTDGGFIGVGHSKSDLWVVKFDSDGGLEWERRFGGMDSDDGYDISLIPGGGYYVLGRTYSSDGDVCQHRGDGDLWVVQLNETGNLVWQKTFGGSSYDYPAGGIITSSDGFIVVGETLSNDGDAQHIPKQIINIAPIWIIRVNNLRYENLNVGIPDTSICLGSLLSLHIDSILCTDQIVWNTGETGVEIQADTQGVYWGEIRSGNCSSRDSVRIHYVPCNGEPCVVFPNAFTPNGDGVNDYFRPIVLCGDMVVQQIWVYNRWGQMIYKADNLGGIGWNGTSQNGDTMPSDVYVWRCVYQNSIGDSVISETVQGGITLLR
jgi:gliding motility-associated-like protein